MWWHIGRVDVFGPVVGSNSTLAVTLVLHLQLPVALRHVNSDTVSIAVVWSVSV